MHVFRRKRFLHFSQIGPKNDFSGAHHIKNARKIPFQIPPQPGNVYLVGMMKLMVSEKKQALKSWVGRTERLLILVILIAVKLIE